jgi:hypothetical protein
MMLNRSRAATCLLLGASILASCQTETQEPEDAVGHHLTHLSVGVGSIWGGGYSVEVRPQDYVVVGHASCPDAKDTRFPEDPMFPAEGLCVLRITKEQSDRFEAAMEPFKRHAVPMESYSFDSPQPRPDGKPCKNEVTDSTLVNLLWTGTEGVKIATFYFGCDREEFRDFYESVLAVTDPLPIQQIIAER